MFELIRQRAAVLALFLAAYIIIAHGHHTCLARMSICTIDNTCKVDDAEFAMPLIGPLKFAQYAPGEYGVLYPCAFAGYEICAQAPVLNSVISRRKVFLNCTRTCVDHSEHVVVVNIRSSCQNNLTGLGLSVGPEVQNAAFLSDGSLYFATQKLPLEVAVYHPDHTHLNLTVNSPMPIVELQCKVNGGWGPWLESPCSQTCGTGTRIRFRTCDTPAPANDGMPCVGESIATVTCNEETCPAWGPWTEGTCSQTCGNGIRTRTRLCDQPAPAAVNQACVGESNITVACNTEPCPAWGPWTEGTCSRTCGTGIRTRTRLCDQPAPAAVNQACVGESNITVACNTEPCPAWGPWTEGACSLTCGTGSRTRTRLCDQPAPAACVGESSVTLACNTEPCPAWGTWTDGQCSRTCGSGTLTRTRQCDQPAPVNVNQACDGKPTVTVTCNAEPCPAEIPVFICASQTTTAFNGDPGRAIDGNLANRYGQRSCTHTDFATDERWTGLLETTSTVQRVVIYNRAGCCADRLNDFSVLVGTQLCARFQGTAGSGATLELTCSPGPLVGDSVTIVQNLNTALECIGS